MSWANKSGLNNNSTAFWIPILHQPNFDRYRWTLFAFQSSTSNMLVYSTRWEAGFFRFLNIITVHDLLIAFHFNWSDGHVSKGTYISQTILQKRYKCITFYQVHVGRLQAYRKKIICEIWGDNFSSSRILCQKWS